MSKTKVIEKIKKGIHGQYPSMTDKKEKDEKEAKKPLPYEIGYLTPDLLEEAKTKLNETEENKERCIRELKELLEKEPNLVSRTDDNFLIQFLRARKYNVSRAFKMIQNYYLWRKEHAEIYEVLDIAGGVTAIMKNYFGFLKHRDRNGSVIVVLKIGLWNPEEEPIDVLMRTLTAIMAHAIEDPATQVAGFRAIFDCRNISWKQIKHCTPHNVMLVIRSTQQCFPGRYKGIHVLTGNELFHIAWSIFYPFLTSKIRKRIMIHGSNLEALKEYIDPSILPVEYGGEAEPFDNSTWAYMIERDINNMIEMLKYGYK